MIVGLMACDPKGCISKDGRLPWRCPQEIHHFQSVTFHKTMVMGRKTFEILPRSIFSQRNSIVFSHTKTPPIPELNTVFVTTIEEYLDHKDLSYHYMIGGVEIAHLFLDNELIDQFLLSVMDQEYPGDKYLDLEKLKVFRMQSATQYEGFVVKDLLKPVELRRAFYA